MRPRWGTSRSILCAAAAASAFVWCPVAPASAQAILFGDTDRQIARAAEPEELVVKPRIDPWNGNGSAASPKIETAPGATPMEGARIPIRPVEGDITRKLVQWVLLRDSDETGDFAKITDFIEANPDWPGLGAARRKAERAITPDMSDHRLRSWFASHSPLTVEGATAYANLLLQTGDRKEATDVVHRAWIRFDMDKAEERAFLDRFGRLIGMEQHWARLDRLLWENRRTAAKRQMPNVTEEYRLLAEARLRLMLRKKDAPASVERVPASLAGDPGLMYEWVRWNRRQENDDVAAETLLMLGSSQIRPNRWWTERQILARRLLRDGDALAAYRLVRDHGLKSKVERAEAEFLAGWIALRFLSYPHKAFGHFSRLYEAVGSPISLARAAYWSGRAAEDAGETGMARRWYATAARHGATFYGQLAANRIGIVATPELSREPKIGQDARAAFERDELVRAVRLLVELRKSPPAASSNNLDPHDEPEAFLASQDQDKVLLPLLRQIARRADTPEEWVLAGRLAREADRIEVAVAIARRSARDGVLLGDLGYPTMTTLDDIPPGPALLHALIRQESAFDVDAKSRAGARGLMQLMPATARKVARELNVKGHSTSRLTSDPRHNVLLGSSYLESMLSRYEGSMVMALAAYNAGPHRVDKWIEENGDPRTNLDNAIDWIESIPFSETRNYVQRILEALPIYRQKLGGARIAALQPEDVAGRLPGYLSPAE
jgi:soluble lytic murein transglycosylase